MSTTILCVWDHQTTHIRMWGIPFHPINSKKAPWNTPFSFFEAPIVNSCMQCFNVVNLSSLCFRLTFYPSWTVGDPLRGRVPSDRHQIAIPHLFYQCPGVRRQIGKQLILLMSIWWKDVFQDLKKPANLVLKWWTMTNDPVKLCYQFFFLQDSNVEITDQRP